MSNDRLEFVSMIFFEDLVLDESVEYGTCTIDREEMIEFARRYDPQPFHLSDEEAAASHFGRVSASGWFTCANVKGLVARYYIDNGLKGLGSGPINRLRDRVWVDSMAASRRRCRCPNRGC
jgi:acyl dehydratase